MHFLLMCDFTVLKWNFKMNPLVMVPGWFRLIGEVLRVRNNFSANFFCVSALFIKLCLSVLASNGMCFLRKN